ncbi:transient receptor potential channel pyrexia-like [Cydia splendana]|uniref:transient receptor potential channel pyrexia-like n=1 Tax=Cydia splendana TaxID=1100963 RepID=UPI0028F476BD
MKAKDMEPRYAVESDGLPLLPLSQTTSEDSLYAVPGPPPLDKLITPKNAIHYQHPEAQLLLAVKWNHVEEVEKLLEAGFDPNALYTMSWYEAEAQMQYIPTTHNQEERYRFNMLPTWPANEKPVWSALHSASARGHVVCARALLAHGASPDGAGNTRRTALDVAGSAFYYDHHVHSDHLAEMISLLLEAGGTFHTMRGDGFDNLNTPLHTATLLESADAIRALLEAGASVACINSVGYTPLHLCLRNKFEELLEILLYYNCDDEESSLRVNVVDKRGYSVLKTAVELKWLPGVCLALEAGADAASSFDHLEEQACTEMKTTLIHLAVQGRNTTILEKVLTIAEQENLIDCINSDGDTPLCVAIRNGHLECAKALLHHGAGLEGMSTDNSNALHIAAAYGRTAIMKYLLESVDDSKNLFDKYNKDGLLPIHLAAKKNSHECVQLLLKSGNCQRLRTQDETFSTALHFAARGDYVDVARAIIKKDPRAIDDVNHRGFTPMHEAAFHCSNKIMLFLLHETDAVLSSFTADNSKNLVIKIITSQLPNPGDFLETVFDSFTHYDNKQDETEISVKYGFLTTRSHNMTQIQVIEELVRCGQRNILLHPLMESLLYLKWKTLLPFFYVMITIYGMFVLTFNIFVVTFFFYCDTNQTQTCVVYNYNKVITTTTTTTTQFKSLIFQHAFWVFMAFTYIMIGLMLILEIFYLAVNKRRYFQNLETWIRLLCMALAGVVPLGMKFALPSEEWPRHVATAALLLAWLQMLFLLSRFPNWGYYVLMFGEVACNIFKILLTFVFLVLGFSLSFMIQYRAKDPFENPWKAFVKTTVMMTQEFNYDDMFDEKHEKILGASTEVTRFLFGLFLMFVGIVLMNFMVGVAVSNVNELNVAGNTKRLEKQVELLITLDFLVYGLISKIFPINTYYKRYHYSINNFPTKEKLWRIRYYFDLNDALSHDDIYIPLHLRRDIVKKAMEQNNVKVDTKDIVGKKIDVLYDALIDKVNDTVEDKETKTKLDGVMEMLVELSNDMANLKEQMRSLKETSTNSHTLSYRRSRRGKRESSRSKSLQPPMNMRLKDDLYDSMYQVILDFKEQMEKRETDA